MKSTVKSFFHRGLIFGGFGPVIVGIIYLILSVALDNFYLSGGQVFTAIISTYLLAFVHAGASVFNQIEHWPIMKSLLCHFATLYAAYVICYLINSWIPFNINVIGIFTAIFVGIYLAIWVIVYFCTKSTGRKLNERLK